MMYRKSLPVLRQHQGLHNTPLKLSSCALQQYCHPCPAALPHLLSSIATPAQQYSHLPSSIATPAQQYSHLPSSIANPALPPQPKSIATPARQYSHLPSSTATPAPSQEYCHPCPAIQPPVQQYCHLPSSTTTCPAQVLSHCLVAGAKVCVGHGSLGTVGSVDFYVDWMLLCHLVASV